MSLKSAETASKYPWQTASSLAADCYRSSKDAWAGYRKTMTLLGRLARMMRAEINHWIQAAEDPETVLDQVVTQMQLDLVQLRQSIAQAIAIQKRTERQCIRLTEQSQVWYDRAQSALLEGDEPSARAALAQRQQQFILLAQLQTASQQQQTVVVAMKADLRKLESYIADARTRRDLYVARMRSAEASQRVRERLRQTAAARSAINTLSRFEDPEKI